jgi:ribosomal protein S18 acetylase RimI-like enzyme
MSQTVLTAYHKIIRPNSDGRDWLTYHRASAGTVEIDDLNVLTQRRRGHGRQLVQMFLEEVADACTIFLFTRGANVVAQRFYEACGFVRMATIDKFYENEDRVGVFYVLNRK